MLSVTSASNQKIALIIFASLIENRNSKGLEKHFFPKKKKRFDEKSFASGLVDETLIK
jgi:predicted hydrolase (HD superfamily)